MVNYESSHRLPLLAEAKRSKSYSTASAEQVIALLDELVSVANPKFAQFDFLGLRKKTVNLTLE